MAVDISCRAMIDTNSINQVAGDAQAIKTQLVSWWPAICVVGAVAGREICKVNGWLEYVCGAIIAHGGVGNIARKLIWNPAADQLKRS